jgi:hypothetical protein
MSPARRWLAAAWGHPRPSCRHHGGRRRLRLVVLHDSLFADELSTYSIISGNGWVA